MNNTEIEQAAKEGYDIDDLKYMNIASPFIGGFKKFVTEEEYKEKKVSK